MELTGDSKPQVILNDLKSRMVNGADYYLHIVSDNIEFKKFTLEIDYDNQDGEWFPIDRSDRFDNKGHYYVEFSDKISGNVDRITMNDIQRVRANLDITLCRKPETKVLTEEKKEIQP